MGTTSPKGAHTRRAASDGGLIHQCRLVSTQFLAVEAFMRHPTSFSAYPPLSLVVHALPDEVHLPPCAAAHEALPDRCIKLQRCAMVGRRRRGSSSTTPTLPTTKSSDVANSSADAPADASNATYHHRRFNPATSYNDVRKEELAGGRPSVREEEIASRGRSRNIA